MNSIRAIASILLTVRVVAGLLLLLYLYVIIVSRSVPLSSGLEGPLTFGGGLALTALIVSRLLRSLDWRGGPAIPTGCLLHLAFVAVAGLTFYFVLTGNVSYGCPDQDQATSCVKLDNWKMSAGHYYRHFPYDSDLSPDPDTPWVEISRPEYVAEVGTRLRIAALFSVVVLCLAWALSGSLLQPSKDGRSTSNLKLMDPVLPPRRGL